MAVAVTAAVAASSGAMAASNAARIQARKEECKVVIDRFDSNGATVAKAQEYAACVQTIYPVYKEMSPNATIAAKCALVAVIVFIVVFCIWFGKKEGDGFTGYLFGFMFAMFSIVGAALISWGLAAAFLFLIS